MELKIDLSYLENLSAGDNNLIKELIKIFKEQVPQFIAEMKQSIENKDSNALALVAHKAKSSVAIIGIIDIAEELKVLEKIASNNERSKEYPDFLKRFETSSSEAIKLLNNIVAKL